MGPCAPGWFSFANDTGASKCMDSFPALSSGYGRPLRNPAWAILGLLYQCRLDQKQDRHRRTAHAGMQLGQLLPHLPTLMESLRNELDGNLLTPDSANCVHNGPAFAMLSPHA